MDDLSSNVIAWDRLFRRFLLASFALPLYVVLSYRGSSALGPAPQPPPSRVSFRVAVFVFATLYWLILYGCSALYFIARPPDISITEALLPLLLHFFCFFVEALLCSIEMSSAEHFDEAADRMMCKMHVSGTSFQWTTRVDAGWLPDSLKTSSGGPGAEDSDSEEGGHGPESENLVSPNSSVRRSGSVPLESHADVTAAAAAGQLSGGMRRAQLTELVNMILKRQEAFKDGPWLGIATIVCSAVYAFLPQVMRLASGTYRAQSAGVAFFIVAAGAVVTNFIICAVALDALAKSVSQLKFRRNIARSFMQLTSKTAAATLGLFYFELQTIENLWGWLTLRSYLLRRGKRPQARVEVILSAAFAFLAPLALMLALDVLLSKTPVSIFIVSSFYFCFVLASFLLLCVWHGVHIQATYRDQDVLMSEQLAIHYRICTTRDPDLHKRLKHLHDAIAKIMHIMQSSAGTGVVLSILGFAINENFARVLIGGLLSLASAGFSSVLRWVLST